MSQISDNRTKYVETTTNCYCFTGTTRGRVLKVINAKSADSKEDVKTVVIEELQVFPPGTNIKELKVMYNKIKCMEYRHSKFCRT